MHVVNFVLSRAQVFSAFIFERGYPAFNFFPCWFIVFTVDLKVFFLFGLQAVGVAPTFVSGVFGGDAHPFIGFSQASLFGFVIAAFFRVFQLGKKCGVFIANSPQTIIGGIEVTTQRRTPFLTPNSTLKFERHFALIEVSTVLN